MNDAAQIKPTDPSRVENELAEGKSSFRGDRDRAPGRSLQEAKYRHDDERAVHESSFQDGRGRIERES